MPVASTRPAFIATSQSNRAASSMYAVATMTLMPGRSARMRSIELPELPARERIHAGGRLVEDQQIRVVDQRAAEAQLLLHAAGQLAGRTIDERGEAGAPGEIARCDARARHGPARTAGRRSRCSRTPTASDRDSCRAPAACRRCAVRRPPRWAGSAMSPPSTSTVPVWIRRAPAISASRLDLPTPSGPISPTMHCGGTSRSTASSACVVP